jgi:hypothetical protein
MVTDTLGIKDVSSEAKGIERKKKTDRKLSTAKTTGVDSSY